MQCSITTAFLNKGPKKLKEGATGGDTVLKWHWHLALHEGGVPTCVVNTDIVGTPVLMFLRKFSQYRKMVIEST